MKVLFIHQNRPGQFAHLAPHLIKQGGYEITFISKPSQDQVPGAKQISYRLPEAKGEPHPFLKSLQDAVKHGQIVARVLTGMRQRDGYRPDIVFAHPGWGEALFVKDVWPDVPLLNYSEFYYHPFGADTNFDPKEPVKLDAVFRVRTRNCVHLLNLHACDWGICPTYWQWRQHPAAFLPKISVIHDGINMEVAKPDPAARLDLPDGRSLGIEDEVVTYVARHLEPYRGFPAFMRAAKLVSERRPGCQLVVVGADQGRGYGPTLAGGKTFRDVISEEVKIDPARIHFLGRVPYERFMRMLQISSAHVYLTVPFVLSWSMLEAMSAGCVVIGSNTPPVAEIIEDGWNGLLADLLSSEEIAERIEEALADRERMAPIRRRARETVAERYELSRCIDQQVRLMNDLVEGRRPRSDPAPAPAPAGERAAARA